MVWWPINLKIITNNIPSIDQLTSVANQQDNSGKSSACSSSRFTYDVSLSFRGSDVRYEFADFLYRTLRDAGLRVYLNDDEIKMGADFDKIIKKVIRESKVAVIIFSRDFASSTYCLDEVVRQMKRRARGEVQVLPVFYKVHPRDVRHLGEEAYGVSFQRHEKRFESDKLGCVEGCSSTSCKFL